MSDLDLSTYGGELTAAFRGVCGDDDTNWLIAGYKGKTNALMLVESGDGGLEEAVEEFEDGKVLYGFVRVTDPNTKVTKYVFVHWIGQTAPEARKASSPNHVRAIQSLFHGAHVTISARNDADLDVASIFKKVESASGANYSSREKADPRFANTESGTVGSVYKNQFQNEGVSTSRTQFWNENQAETTTASYENEFSAKGLSATSERGAFWEQQQREEEERKQEEAERLAAQEAELAEQQQQQTIPEPEPAVAEPEPEYEHNDHTDEPDTEPQYQQESQYEQETPTESQGLRAVALYDYEAQEEGELTFDPDEIITSIEKIDEGWWQGVCRGVSGLFPANYVQVLED